MSNQTSATLRNMAETFDILRMGAAASNARAAATEIEQMRAENTRLKAECEQLSETVMGQERVIEDLEPDARRYRTLRQMNWNTSPLCVVTQPKESVKLGYDCPFGERLDQMLDEIEEQRTPR
ncbi:MAG: hypothetical protein KJ890_15580 [Gammaproteobacteria bacterium]|nr:hypothetical protein [Gammaproteobacteria bacterium]MBU1803850.1 hypothetical protein [Gammaproteobacteria bacterium]